MARLKPVQHDERLTLVEHLGELRNRLFVAGGAFLIALIFCFSQRGQVLDIYNAPLDEQLVPVTLGVAEQFTTALTTSAYAALLIALPVILFEMYAFVLPAFSPTERRVALPLLLMVPVLFITGVVFAYFVIVPPALDFLIGFEADSFQTLLRAREYYSFLSMTLIAMGLLFQIPVGVLAATKLGITTPQKLRRARRYAVVVIAFVAMLMPGQDPVTMLIAMVPLYLLYEISILLTAAFGRPSDEVAEHSAAEDE